MKCEIENCISPNSKYLFRSPLDKKRLKKWQKAVGTKAEQFSVCERHFPKESVIVLKNLVKIEEPSLHLNDTVIKLDNYCCGFCFESLKGKMISHKMKENYVEYFKEISGYTPLTNFMCHECKISLKSYKSYQTDIQEKHRRIRRIANEKIEAEQQQKLEPFKKSFKCGHCNIYVTDSTSHIKEEHSFHCDDCSFVYRDSNSLESHAAIIHPNSLPWHCPALCNLSFSSKASLDIHMERLHQAKEFPCIYCNRKFNLALNLRVHVVSSHPYNKRLAFKTKIEMLRKSFEPIKKVISNESHGKLVSILKKRIVREESAASNDTKMEEEPEADFAFAEGDIIEEELEDEPEQEEDEPEPEEGEDEPEIDIALVDNEESLQNPEDLLIHCEHCFEAVPEQKLEAHLKRFHGCQGDAMEEEIIEEVPEPPRKKKKSNIIDDNRDVEGMLLKCLDCGLQLAVEDLLKHRLEEHPDEDDVIKAQIDAIPRMFHNTLIPKESFHNPSRYLVHCEFCFEAVPEGRLETHLKNFHRVKEKPFLCHQCSKQFESQRLLDAHIICYNPDQMPMCDICGRRSANTSHMDYHMRYHLGIGRKFKGTCKICLKKLTCNVIRGSRSIKEHLEKYHPNGYDCGARVNSETNLFDCFKCGGSYIDIFTYRNHNCERGKFQLRCNDCRRHFGSAKKLRIHQEKGCMMKDGFGYLVHKLQKPTRKTLV